MKFLVFSVMLLSFLVKADVEKSVLIRGKVSNSFNETEVKVVDSFNQSYFIPRHYFPKNFDVKQGNSFAIELPEEELDKLKINVLKK